MPAFRPTISFTLFYLSLVVLIPLSTLVFKSFELHWNDYVDIITNKRVLAAFRVSFTTSLGAAAIASFFGFIVAWVLVRYSFAGKRFFHALIDLPLVVAAGAGAVAVTSSRRARERQTWSEMETVALVNAMIDIFLEGQHLLVHYYGRDILDNPTYQDQFATKRTPKDLQDRAKNIAKKLRLAVLGERAAEQTAAEGGDASAAYGHDQPHDAASEASGLWEQVSQSFSSGAPGRAVAAAGHRPAASSSLFAAAGSSHKRSLEDLHAELRCEDDDRAVRAMVVSMPTARGQQQDSMAHAWGARSGMWRGALADAPMLSSTTPT